MMEAARKEAPNKSTMKGRVVLGSSMSKKILESGSKEQKKRSNEKNAEFEYLYYEESVKAKERYKRLFKMAKNNNHGNRVKSNLNYVSEDEELENELKEFYYSIFEDIVEEKILELHKGLSLKVPEIEYLLAMSEHFGINPKAEPHLLWVIRLADYMPLPQNWQEKLGSLNNTFQLQTQKKNAT